jgi:hypothetical protein
MRTAGAVISSPADGLDYAGAETMPIIAHAFEHELPPPPPCPWHRGAFLSWKPDQVAVYGYHGRQDWVSWCQGCQYEIDDARVAARRKAEHREAAEREQAREAARQTWAESLMREGQPAAGPGEADPDPPTVRGGRPAARNAARDAAIFDAYECGVSMTEIGRMVDRSRDRIKQIVRDERTRRKG